MKRSRWIALAVAALAVALVTAGTAAGASQHRKGGAYTVTPLVSDQPGVAPTTDPNLVNGWGIAAGPTSPWWVANEASDTSTLYDGAGNRLPPPPTGPLVVSVLGGPRGIVYYGGDKFLVSNGTSMVASRFIFGTHAGQILGWPTPPPLGTDTVVAVDSSTSGAVYTGLAIAGEWLYAADFANGHVDVFNNKWKLVKKHGAFTDPFLPKGYSPFGIQAIGDSVFVAYAQAEEGGEEVVGPGLGVVDQYSLSGELQHRVATRGKLNAPWGIAWAPAKGFGKASGALLVGNFGDGRINAFRQDKKGRWKKAGQLLGSDRKPIWVDGLWGIGFGFGNDASGPATTLYFAAGPDGETHGLFGSITADTP